MATAAAMRDEAVEWVGVLWEWEEMLVGSVTGGGVGPVAGRLEGALRGAEGELGRRAALQALDTALLRLGTRPSEAVMVPPGPGALLPGALPAHPAPLPVWVVGEALPGLLDLALAPQTPKDQQETSAKLLHHLCLPTHIDTVVAAVLSGWARYEEGLSRCFHQETFDKELAGLFLGLLEEYGMRDQPPPPTLPAHPLLGVLERLLSLFRRRPDLGALKADVGSGDSTPLLPALKRVLYPGRSFSVEDVLVLPGLAEGTFQAMEAAGYVMERNFVFWEFLQAVSATDERVCVFLRQGGARLLLDDLRLQLPPSSRVTCSPSQMLGAIGELLPATLAPASLALRARLLSDAGLTDYLRLRAASGRCYGATMTAHIKPLLAALRQPVSRLPSYIRFPDS